MRERSHDGAPAAAKRGERREGAQRRGKWAKNEKQLERVLRAEGRGSPHEDHITETLVKTMSRNERPNNDRSSSPTHHNACFGKNSLDSGRDV